MRKVFKDKCLEEKFQEEGYAHVPFLSTDETKSLWNAFHDLIKTSGGNLSNEEFEYNVESNVSYDFTFIDKNTEYKKAVFNTIFNVFNPYVEKYLDDYIPIIANFIRKKPNGGEVPLHQNWAFIDETKGTSVSIWVPLVDSNRENGALEVVPKSHKKFGKYRGPLIPWELENIKNQIIENDLITCDIKAGDAIILDDSIVHYSFPNKSKSLRIAIQLILIPKEMPSIHYHKNIEKNTSEIDVLQVNKDFYMNFNPWKKPDLKYKVSSISYDSKPLSYSMFKKSLLGKRFDKPKSVFQKILERF